MTARDALIFLGGANLGAAAYEYGLARAAWAFLGRGRRSYASFDTDWAPEDYLRSYYAEVEPDEQRTIAFFVDALRDLPGGASVLVFGAGPTLHHVFLAAEKARRIDLCDYLASNLREIERWIAGDPCAHDWMPFVRHTLACEGTLPSGQAVARREALTRDRIGRLMEVDLRRPDPLGVKSAGYDLVVSAYCADSATDDPGTWWIYMGRIMGVVRPGGLLLTAALHDCRGYVVGGRLFPSPGLGEADMRQVLEAGFGPAGVSVEIHSLPGHDRHGYSGIILARASAAPDSARATAASAAQAAGEPVEKIGGQKESGGFAHKML